MKYDDMIDEIILSNHLDKYYPRFREFIRAKDLIRKLFDEHEEVILIVSDDEEVNIVEDIVGKRISYVMCKRNNVELSSAQYVWNKSYEISYDLSKLDKQLFAGRLPVVLFRDALLVYNWLKKNEICFIDIYDYFSCNGLYIAYDFWDIFPQNSWNLCHIVPSFDTLDSVTLEIINYSAKIKSVIGREYEIQYLERLYFLFVYEKNFVMARKTLDRIMELGADDSFIESWKSIESVLESLKRKVKQRESRDVICFWIDDVSYYESKKIQFVSDNADDGIWFKNAFTCSPWTNPTYKLILTGKNNVDDESFMINCVNAENSEFLSYLSKEGYSFLTCGENWNALDSMNKGPKRHPLYCPCSTMIWDSLQMLSSCDGPLFSLTHILQECHRPHWSYNMCNSVSFNENSRKESGLCDISEQLSFYDPFFGENSYRIYFSDHGSAIDKMDSDFHTFLLVKNEHVKKRVIRDMFSYEDMPLVFRQLIHSGDIDDSTISRDYVKIQDLDLYSEKRVRYILEHRLPLSASEIVGYKGIIDRDYMYLHLNNKVETICPVNASLAYQKKWIDCDLKPSGFDEYRKICDVVIDYSKNIKEKTRFSRHLYSIANELLPIFKKKINLIRRLLSDLPTKGVAIRGGGEHTIYLLSYFKNELKNVEFIIDNNTKDCVFENEYHVISPNEIGRYGITHVISSSKDYNEFFIEELEGIGDLNIIDIYGFLRSNGIDETNEFHLIAPDDYLYERELNKMSKQVSV